MNDGREVREILLIRVEMRIQIHPRVEKRKHQKNGEMHSDQMRRCEIVQQFSHFTALKLYKIFSITWFFVFSQRIV